jgi:hypothetical protein
MFRFNDVGQLLFQAQFAGADEGSGSGLFLAGGGAIDPVVTSNDPLPDGATTVLRRPSKLMAASDDELLFQAFKSGGKGVYFTKSYKKGKIRRIIGEGDDLPANGGRVMSLGQLQINDLEQVAIHIPVVAGGPVYPSDAIYIHTPTGGLQLIARTGDPAPAATGTLGTFAYIGQPSFNHIGQVAFYANMADYPPSSTGVFLGQAGQPLRKVARTGDTTSSGEVLKGVYVNPQVNDSGKVAFLAQVAAPAGPYTLYLWLGGAGVTPRKMAAPGDTVAGATIDSLNPQFEFNRADQAALVAPLTDGREAILIATTASAPRPVAVTGDTAPGTDGGTFKNFEYIGITLNRSGEVAFWAEVDGSLSRSGYFLGSAGAAPKARLVEGQILPDGETAGPQLRGLPAFALSSKGEVAIAVLNFGLDPQPARNVIVASNGKLRLFGQEAEPADGTGGSFGRFGNMIWVNSSGDFFFYSSLVGATANIGEFWEGGKVPQ